MLLANLSFFGPVNIAVGRISPKLILNFDDVGVDIRDTG